MNISCETSVFKKRKNLNFLILDHEGHPNEYLIVTGNVAHELEMEIRKYIKIKYLDNNVIWLQIKITRRLFMILI